MKLVCAVVLGGLICAGAANAQTVERAVISSGAVRVEGSGITLQGTIGQPIIGPVGSSLFAVGQGFWYRKSGLVNSVDRAYPLRVRLHPQPVVTLATVEIECSSLPEGAVHTVQGQRLEPLVFQRTDEGYRAQVDCTLLASGLYLVQLRCGATQMFLPMMIAK
ncbi:MAG: hypothetical protein RML15_09240 [Bacteroidota bacterium]|nr:hypothetical protein [Bacteroidota bacterium]